MSSSRVLYIISTRTPFDNKPRREFKILSIYHKVHPFVKKQRNAINMIAKAAAIIRICAGSGHKKSPSPKGAAEAAGHFNISAH